MQTQSMAAAVLMVAVLTGSTVALVRHHRHLEIVACQRAFSAELANVTAEDATLASPAVCNSHCISAGV
jgi:hypothetical protein